MIFQCIFNVLFNIVHYLLSFLPDVSWSVEASFFTKFLDIIALVGYLLPMNTIAAILTLVVVINLFKIVVSVIKTLWQLIPFL